MEKYYSINEVSQMTGLTTRTIRNYLKTGLVNGEKINGVWAFSDENFNNMISNPVIKPVIKTKNNTVVYDFLADSKKSINKICTILDMNTDDEEAAEISIFFCEAINKRCSAEQLDFKFEKHGRNVRVILCSAEETVMELLNMWYS